MRSKKRYLLLEGSKEKAEKAILEYIGILGWAKAAPVFVKTKDGEKNQTVLAVERKELDNVKAALAISSDKIKVLRVSGTLKGLKK